MKYQTSICELPFRLQKPFASSQHTISGIVRKANRSSLVTVGLDGRILSQLELAKDFRFPIGVNSQGMWLAFESRLEQRTLAGEQVTDLELEFAAPQRRVGAAMLDGEGIILAIERLEADEEHGLSGELVRIGVDHEVTWHALLKVGRIAYAGCVEASAQNGFQNLPKPAWKPKQWVTNSQAPILVSGEHVFASWQEFPRSGIGKHYAVRHADGQTIASTQPYPVSWTCNLLDGGILISAGGYGACWTKRLGPATKSSGAAESAWPTHGRLFQSLPGELFCIEMLPESSRDSHIVRLSPDGTCECIGPPLPGYQTSAPVRLDDHRFCFWRGGHVWICDPRVKSLATAGSIVSGKLDYSEAVPIADDLAAIVVYRAAKGPAAGSCQLVVVGSGRL